MVMAAKHSENIRQSDADEASDGEDDGSVASRSSSESSGNSSSDSSSDSTRCEEGSPPPSLNGDRIRQNARDLLRASPDAPDNIINIESNIALSKAQASSAMSQLSAEVATLEDKLEAVNQSNFVLSGQVVSLQKSNVNLAKHLCEKEAALEKSTLNTAQWEDALSEHSIAKESIIKSLECELTQCTEKLTLVIEEKENFCSFIKEVAQEAEGHSETSDPGEISSARVDETIQNLQSSISSIKAEKEKAIDDIHRLQANNELVKSELEAAVTSKNSAIEKERKQCMDKLELVTKVGKNFACAVVKLTKELEASNATVQKLQAMVLETTRGKGSAVDANKKTFCLRSEPDDFFFDPDTEQNKFSAFDEADSFMIPGTPKESKAIAVVNQNTSCQEQNKTTHSLLEYTIQKRSMDLDFSHLVNRSEKDLHNKTSGATRHLNNDPAVRTSLPKKAIVPSRSMEVDLFNLANSFEEEKHSEATRTNCDWSNDSNYPIVESSRLKKSRVPSLRRLRNGKNLDKKRSQRKVKCNK